ncbi:MAG TPA: glycosyltransferase, partial [Rhodoferax sp.]|nr:glycosyltransferase [Rhodoferax sp.]
VIDALLHGNDVGGYPSLIAVITFLGGVQLLSIGVVGEYVGKTYFEAKQRPLYLLRDVVQHPRAVPPRSEARQQGIDAPQN